MDKSIVSQDKDGEYWIHRSNRRVFDLYRVVYSVQPKNQSEYEKKILEAQETLRFVAHGNVAYKDPALLNLVWGIYKIAQIENLLFSSFFSMVNGKLTSFERHDKVKQYVNSDLMSNQKEREDNEEEERMSDDTFNLNDLNSKYGKESEQFKKDVQNHLSAMIDYYEGKFREVVNKAKELIEEKDRLLAEATASLQEKDKLLDETKASLLIKKKNLADANDSLQEKDEQILNITKLINENNKWFEESKKVLAEKNSELEKAREENARMRSDSFRKEMGEDYLRKVFEEYLKDADEMEQSLRKDWFNVLQGFCSIEGVPREVREMIRSLRKKPKGGDGMTVNTQTYVETQNNNYK